MIRISADDLHTYFCLMDDLETLEDDKQKLLYEPKEVKKTNEYISKLNKIEAEITYTQMEIQRYRKKVIEELDSIENKEFRQMLFLKCVSGLPFKQIKEMMRYRLTDEQIEEMYEKFKHE